MTVTNSSSSGSSEGGSGSSSSGPSSEDGGPIGTSCQTSGPGLSNCGPGGSGTESCCASLEVPGGTYYRTYDFSDAGIGIVELAADGGPTGLADPATVSGFRLDKYDVTVGRFRQFVNAVQPTDAGPAGYVPPAGSGKHTHLNGGQGLLNSASDAGAAFEPGWIAADDVNIAPTNANLLGCVGTDDEIPLATWTASVGAQENLPIDCVNWYEAYAFCIWDGGFLPSEAEYEYAAAGGSEQRVFPWGSADPGTANQYGIYACNYPYQVNDSSDCTGPVNFAPVGTPSLGAGRWGQLDLGGNVWQWDLDWAGLYVDPCTDCADLTPGVERIMRGGGQAGLYWYMVPSLRADALPSARANTGFRCARTP